VNPTILAHGVCRGTLARAGTAGAAPREILESVDWADWAKDGSSLAIIHYVAGKSRLEFPVGKVLYETGGYLTNPRISPDGKRIAFLDHPVWPDDRGTVAAVDLAGKKTTLSGEYASEDGLAWVPSGKEVWFTASDSGNTRSLRAASLDGKARLISRIPGTARLQDISPEGRVLFTRDEQNNGIIVSMAGNGERDLSWMDWSLVRDITPDGKWILFDEEGDGGGEFYSTYVRKTDGSPPVRLGDGGAYAISKDGKWALANLPKSPQQLVLLPTGAGEPHLFERNELVEYTSADFFPDGKRLLVCGNEAGRAPHCFVQPLEGGPMRAVTPEGVLVWPGGAHAISPDGNSIAVVDAQGQPYIYPASGGEGKQIPGTTPGDIPERWTADGRSIFVYRHREFPTKVYRLDVTTGKKELWQTLTMPDPTGLASIGWIQPTPDGNSYAFTYARGLSQLYLADGLR
jgi:eukaryotic-like serine/threonine-protein kinase